MASKLRTRGHRVVLNRSAGGDTGITVMLTILGAFIGAFLAGAIVIISYMFNDTIMTADDIERKLGMHVLGTLPLEDTEYDGKKRKTKMIRSLNAIAKKNVK